MALNSKITHFNTLIEDGNFDSFFFEAANFTISIYDDPKYINIIFESKMLDHLCLNAGRKIVDQYQDAITLAGQYKENCSVYLTTQLYLGTGGHTLALKDIIRAKPNDRHVVFLSNATGDSQFNDEYCRSIFLEFGDNVEIKLAPHIEYSHKFLWILEQIIAIRPDRLYLFNHPYDTILVGLAQPELAKEIFFFHHGDHKLCLGVHIPYAHHIDCSELSYQQCRHRFGVTNNVFWPLVSPDQGCLREDHIFMINDEFTTASHGSFIKFQHSTYNNLPDRYSDLVLARLQHCKGKHLHLGGLAGEVQQEIVERMKISGISAERFLLFNHVPSLWRWLLDNKVDLCINSYPTQGFKGMVETMGAGIPMIVHKNSYSKFYSCPEFAYQGVFEWENLSEFIDQLKLCTSSLLKYHSNKARLCYEQHHQQKLLNFCVQDSAFVAPQKPFKTLVEDTLGHWYHE